MLLWSADGPKGPQEFVFRFESALAPDDANEMAAISIRSSLVECAYIMGSTADSIWPPVRQEWINTEVQNCFMKPDSKL